MLEVKDLSLCPEPHNQVQAMIMYIWFGVGSVPWIGQGKYVLAKLLFLFTGVIITHQLDVMYVLILAAIIVTDPHLTHLSHTYSVWSLCTKGVVPYLCTILYKYVCTIGLTFEGRPVGKQVLVIPPVEGQVGMDLGGGVRYSRQGTRYLFPRTAIRTSFRARLERFNGYSGTFMTTKQTTRSAMVRTTIMAASKGAREQIWFIITRFM